MTKLAIEQRVATEVEAYQRYIQSIISIHRNCSEPCDWTEINNTGSTTDGELEQIAAGVIAGEVPAFKQALGELNPFAEMKEVGRTVQMSFNQRYVNATIRLYDQDRVPRYTKSLLKTGAESTRPAPEGVINEIYQKHVCSCVLRAARELFAVLPFQKVFVQGTVDLLNHQTGNKETRVIVSVLIPRGTLEVLISQHSTQSIVCGISSTERNFRNHGDSLPSIRSIRENSKRRRCQGRTSNQALKSVGHPAML